MYHDTLLIMPIMLDINLSILKNSPIDKTLMILSDVALQVRSSEVRQLCIVSPLLDSKSKMSPIC